MRKQPLSKNKSGQRAGIVGAGIAGIAAAIRLAALGYEVTVFEANDYPGGKLSVFDLNGYRFDAGPSLFTMPQYVEDLFNVAGESSKTHFSYQKATINCQYFWPDGTTVTAWADRTAFAEEAAAKLGVEGQQVQAFLDNSQFKYRLAGRIFLEKSLHRIATWLRWDVVQALFRLPGFDIFSSMHQTHERWFGAQSKMVQLFDRYATYNGSDPYQASGMLTIIPHFEHNIGVFYPRGGMYQITASLYELSKRQGVQYFFNTPVQQIMVEQGRTTGLKTADGNMMPFDLVVSNMDVFYTYRKLLPDQAAPERILRQPKSTSALIFYWGVKKQFPALDLHNIFFSKDYKAEFDALAQGVVIDDPTIYINITSKFTPTDAPEGCENWFVMINTPCDSGQDWASLIPQIRANTIRKLSAILGCDIAELIDCEAILEPKEIERRTSSHLGALYGYSSNNTMAAFLRHPNFSRKIKGLHFVGGSVHPGGGIPLCLLSAKIMSENIG